MSSKEFEALSRFNGEYLQFPTFVTAFDEIDRLLQCFRQTGVANHLLVTGESGTGKTTLCKTLVQKCPRIILPERDVVPVLFTPIPPAATIASVAEAMLAKLGDPAPTTGTISAKTTRAVHLARACGVELLLFDEANHIQDRGKSPTQYLVGDWLKSLMDEINVPTVLLGLPRVEALLHVNEQLRRRFTRRLSMELGQASDITIEAQCLQLCMSLIPALPVSFSRGNLSWSELGLRLYYASDSKVAYVKVLLAGAIRIAFNQALDEISIPQLESAFITEIWPQGIGELNPFNSTFSFRRLDRQGEPFERGALVERPTKRRSHVS